MKTIYKKSRLTLVKSFAFYLLSILLFSSCGGGNNSEKSKVTYSTRVLTGENRTLTSSYSASIDALQDIEIYPQISGPLTRITPREGVIVKKGDLLFTIDKRPYISALNTAKANVSAARADLATAQLNYDSRKELFNQKVVSEFDLRTAENNLAHASANLELTKAQLTSAETNLSYTEIRSPAEGIIGALPYSVGDQVSPSSNPPLTTVSDNSSMYIFFSMNESRFLALTHEYGSIQNVIDSMPAIRLQLSDGTEYEQSGRIFSINGLVNKETGSIAIKTIFPNNGRILHSGNTGNILIPDQYNNCIVIPQAATYEIQDRRFVYKVIDGKAVSTNINISPVNNGKEFIVTHGLQVGDTIVDSGIATLKNGMQIL